MGTADVLAVVVAALTCLGAGLATWVQYRRQWETERRYSERYHADRAEASLAEFMPFGAMTVGEYRAGVLNLPPLPQAEAISADRQIAQQWEREYQAVTGEPYPTAHRQSACAASR